MDTLAALALATDKPSEELLNRKPSKRSEPIISPTMFVQIVGQAAYQIFVCLLLYFMGPVWFPPAALGANIPPAGWETSTIVFNTFIFCQLFNEVNSRSITNDKNVVRDIFKNQIFVGIVVLTSILQAIIVQFGGQVFRLDPKGLSSANWGWSILIGSGSIIVGYLLRFVPELDIPVWLRAGKITESVSTPTETTQQPEPVAVTAEVERGSAISKWDIVRTQVHAFQVPPGVKAPANIPKIPEDTPFPTSNNIPQRVPSLRFRNYRRDTSTLQMIDPRRVMKAKMDIARARANSSPNLNK